MLRTRKKQQLDGWAQLRTPEVVMALVERFDEVELVEHIFTKAMFNSLSVPALVNRERHDLISKLWAMAFDHLAPFEKSPAYSAKAKQARLQIDVFARACLDALENFEFFDPKTSGTPYQYPRPGSE